MKTVIMQSLTADILPEMKAVFVWEWLISKSITPAGKQTASGDRGCEQILNQQNVQMKRCLFDK